MKNAYVSVVARLDAMPSAATLESLDRELGASARMHEVVLVLPFDIPVVPDAVPLSLAGPVTVVTTHLRAGRDESVVAGLGRAVGDFVVEWHGGLESLDAARLAELLGPTDEGVELVEALGAEPSPLSRVFYSVANSLRPRTSRLRKAVGRLYSRRALGQLLGAAWYEPNLTVLAAELPVRRAAVELGLSTVSTTSLTRRVAEGMALLAKGTRFGSAVPLVLAAVSAACGVGAAVYAVLVLVVRGRTPEGWATLMVVTGLGQAAVLVMLGLTWTRLDTLARGLSRPHDATVAVHVTPSSVP